MNRLVRRPFGYALVVAGVLSLLASLYSALDFFYAHERILFFFPSLAPQVTVEELVSQHDRFDEKWVRVRGELWRRTKDNAILVPYGSGLETLTDKGDNLANLPEHHLYVHKWSVEGIPTLSALKVPQNQPVTIVGEFEAKKPGIGPHIDAAAIINPRQNEFWLPMFRKLLSCLIIWILSVLLAFLGWKTLNLTQNDRHSASKMVMKGERCVFKMD